MVWYGMVGSESRSPRDAAAKVAARLGGVVETTKQDATTKQDNNQSHPWLLPTFQNTRNKTTTKQNLLQIHTDTQSVSQSV